MIESESAILELKADSPSVGRPRLARPADDYGHLGLSRRTVFRWLELGDALQDWPPLDRPSKLEEWWEKVRAAGLAKNRLPENVLNSIRAVEAADVAPPPAAQNDTKESVPPPGGPSLAVFDPQAELKQAEGRLIAIREARDEAYKSNRLAEGDKLDRQYWEKYSDYTVMAKRVADYLERRGELVSRAVVESDLAPRIVGIAVGGMFFFGRIQAELAAAPDLAAQNAIWRTFWREQVGNLMQGRFVPPWLRTAPESLWAELVAFIESKRPADLRLEAS